jgi:hypothetical protein
MVLYDMVLYDNRVSGLSRAGGEPVISTARAHVGIAVKRSVGHFDDRPETAAGGIS